MKIKSISDYDINNAISKINKNDYLNKIQILSEKKLMQLEKYTTKKKKEKLYNFLNYRGWEIDLINEQIKKIY
jgi:regulatory protein